MRPGRPTAPAAGARHARSHRELPASRTPERGPPASRAIPRLKGARGRGRGLQTARGGSAWAGGTPTLWPSTPLREWRGTRRGGWDAGGTSGRLTEAPPPCVHLPRDLRHGPRAPARSRWWQSAGTPALTESASRVYTQGEFSGIRALGAGRPVRNPVACVHAGRGFWRVAVPLVACSPLEVSQRPDSE